VPTRDSTNARPSARIGKEKKLKRAHGDDDDDDDDGNDDDDDEDFRKTVYNNNNNNNIFSPHDRPTRIIYYYNALCFITSLIYNNKK